MLAIGAIFFLEFGLQKQSPWLSFLASLLSPCSLCWVSGPFSFSPGLTLVFNNISSHYVSKKSSIKVLQIQDCATRCFSDKVYVLQNSIKNERGGSCGLFSFATYIKG